METRIKFVIITGILMLLIGLTGIGVIVSQMFFTSDPIDTQHEDFSETSEQASDSNNMSDDVNTEESSTQKNSENTVEKLTIKENRIKVNSNSIGSVWIQCVTIVENTGNTNLYLKTAKYDIETEDGELVDTIDMVSPYPQIIAPGETAIYYEETSFDGNIETTYKSIPKIEATKSNVPLISLPISDIKVSTDKYGYSKVVGRVENNTEEKQTMIYVSIAYYDDNAQLLALHSNTIHAIAPGEKESFECSYITNYFGMNPEQIAEVVVKAYPYQFHL